MYYKVNCSVTGYQPLKSLSAVHVGCDWDNFRRSALPVKLFSNMNSRFRLCRPTDCRSPVFWHPKSSPSERCAWTRSAGRVSQSHPAQLPLFFLIQKKRRRNKVTTITEAKFKRANTEVIRTILFVVTSDLEMNLLHSAVTPRSDLKLETFLQKLDSLPYVFLPRP